MSLFNNITVFKLWSSVVFFSYCTTFPLVKTYIYSWTIIRLKTAFLLYNFRITAIYYESHQRHYTLTSAVAVNISISWLVFKQLWTCLVFAEPSNVCWQQWSNLTHLSLSINSQALERVPFYEASVPPMEDKMDLTFISDVSNTCTLNWWTCNVM